VTQITPNDAQKSTRKIPILTLSAYCAILKQTVNLLAYAYEGSNPSPTTTFQIKTRVEHVGIRHPNLNFLLVIFCSGQTDFSSPSKILPRIFA